MPAHLTAILEALHTGRRPARDEAVALGGAAGEEFAALMSLAAERRKTVWGTTVTYSRKVFIPLTNLCRDTCGYCTFAQPPSSLRRA